MQGSSTALMLAFAGLLTLALLPSHGCIDMNIWLLWAESPFNHGVIDGYALNAHEHPPGLTLILLAAMHLAALFSLPAYLGIKLSFLPFLLASSTVIFIWSQRNLALTLFAHTILAYSCMALGYIDIYFAPFVLLSLYCLQRDNPAAALLAYTGACLIKYPALIALPFLLLYLVTLRPWRTAPRLLLPSVLLAVAVLLPFGFEPLLALQRAFQHNILSAQALNLNWIIGRLLLASGDISLLAQGDQSLQLLSDHQIPAMLKWLSRGLFVAFYSSALLLWARRAKTLENLLVVALLGHFAYFMFAIGAHENHLFLSCLLAMALACYDKRWWSLAVGVCTISSCNLLLFYGLDGHPLELFRGPEFDPASGLPLYEPYPVDIRLLAAAFNLAYFLVLWSAVLRAPASAPACPHPASNRDSVRR